MCKLIVVGDKLLIDPPIDTAQLAAIYQDAEAVAAAVRNRNKLNSLGEAASSFKTNLLFTLSSLREFN